jgi:hypothetical protein
MSQPLENNPFTGLRDVAFTRHAHFRMRDRGVTEFEVFRTITDPLTAVTVDSKTGHYVIANERFTVVVAKRGPARSATVITFIEK